MTKKEMIADEKIRLNLINFKPTKYHKLPINNKPLNLK